MLQTARIAPGGMLFHVLNRGVGRMQIFRAEMDYAVVQCVERNNLRAGLVDLAEDWKWGSLCQRVRNTAWAEQTAVRLGLPGSPTRRVPVSQHAHSVVFDKFMGVSQ
jgi:hypothetical protein